MSYHIIKHIGLWNYTGAAAGVIRCHQVRCAGEQSQSGSSCLLLLIQDLTAFLKTGSLFMHLVSVGRVFQISVDLHLKPSKVKFSLGAVVLTRQVIRECEFGVHSDRFANFQNFP